MEKADLGFQVLMMREAYERTGLQTLKEGVRDTVKAHLKELGRPFMDEEFEEALCWFSEIRFTLQGVDYEIKVANATPEYFIEAFRSHLVRQYRWPVSKAAQYSSQKLLDCYQADKTVAEAYVEIFGVENPEGDKYILPRYLF